jgi:hypothetical protein
MASAFAGVSSGNIQDNAIIVRGNAPRGIVWKLEDVQIPNPTHFADGNVAGGGFVTMFSSQLLTNSDFYTSAFPAEYGNGLSGVFDMKLRNGNNQKREHSFQAGVMGIDFASEGPFAKGKQASYLFNYRYSTFALIKPFIKGMEQLPVYQDLSFKLNFPAGRKGTFSLWGIGGDDKVSEPTTTDSSKWKMDFDRVHTDWRAFTGATGISHRVNTGANTYINSTIASTMYNASYDEDALNNSLTMIDNCDIRIKSNKLVASTYINHKFTSRLMCRTGITGNELYYNLFLRSSNKFAPPDGYHNRQRTREHYPLAGIYAVEIQHH